MIWLVLGLVLFLGIHSVRILAPEWRSARIAAMGENGWKGVYTLVSIIGFVLIIVGYAVARPDAAILFVPPVWTRHIAWLLMVFAMISLMIYALPAGRLKPMLKHPMLLAVKIWALAHLLANGDAASLLLFATFLVWAVADRISVKRRGGALPAAGPELNDIMAVAGGFVLWVATAYWAHQWLFGVNPMV